MNWSRLAKRLLLLLAVLPMALLPSAAVAQDASQQEFERGYFLQTHETDAAGAAAAFEKVLSDRDAPAALKAEASVRLAQCREDLATADLAKLMPPDALAYVEITRPGGHVEQLLRMVGLVRTPNAPPADGRAKGTPLPEGLFLPEDFTISPSLIAELKKLKGAAVALTSIDPQREQVSGVAVLHPGSDDFLRGLLETAVQLLEPDDPIEGYRTYRFQGQAWITTTSSLVIVANSRQEVAAAVARLKDPGAESLASKEQFKRCRADCGNTVLFAYADGQRMMERFGSQLSGKEGAIARAVLDLEHWESFTAAIGTTQKGVQVEARLNLAPGHRNLAYGLIQTAPLSKRSLDYVPQETAAVVLLGLNPPADPAGGGKNSAAGEGARALTAMDIGREIFGNIEEIALFVLPRESGAAAGPAVPEVGLVIAVKDPAKSEAVWNQLLALPAMVGAPGVAAPREITIQGQGGKVYTFPDSPPIVMVQLDGHALAAGTEAAVTAAVKAGAAKSSIRTDASLGALVESLGPTASKAILLDAGRTVQTVASCQTAGRNPAAMQRQAQQLMMIGTLLEGLKLSAVTEEGPTQLIVRVEATGLPNVPAIIKTVAAAQQHGRQQARAANIPAEAQRATDVAPQAPARD
jgi:hypothetical protein